MLTIRWSNIIQLINEAIRYIIKEAEMKKAPKKVLFVDDGVNADYLSNTNFDTFFSRFFAIAI